VFALGDRVAARYRIEATLGRGGLGTTYRAFDEVTQQTVALKLLRRRDPVSVAALRREFLALRGLVHPRLARIRDFGMAKSAQPSADTSHRERRVASGGVPYLTTDLVAGASLATHAQGREFHAVRQAIVDAVEALAFLHGRGLVHGDVKPDNILVSSDGHGTLIDLSCATAPNETGATGGTPGFLAPEVLAGGASAASRDLFALGATLQALAPNLAAELPRPVRDLASALVSEDPRLRPSSALEVLERLGGRATELSRAALKSAFVGREDVVAAANEVLDAFRAERASPRVLVLCGEDGAGRTRCITECKWLAQAFADAIECDARRPQAVRALLARAVGEELPKHAPLSVLLDAVERLARRAHPTVLLVDDAHRLAPDDRTLLERLARALPVDGRVLLVVAGRERMDAGAGVVTHVLGPLSEADVSAWLGDEIKPPARRALLDATFGMPGAIAELVASAQGGLPSVSAVRRASRALRDDGRTAAWADALGDEAKACLASLVASGGAMAIDRARGPGEVLALLEGGHVVEEGGGIRLRRPRDAGAIGRALGERWLLPAHDALAEDAESQLRAALEAPRAEDGRASTADVADALATVLRHRVRAGRALRARRLLDAHADVVLAHPHAFQESLEALANASWDPHTGWLLAEVVCRAGEPRAALRQCAAALRRRPPSAYAARLRRVAGEAYVRAGDARRARIVLTRACGSTHGEERARAAAALGLALLRRGAYADAEASARGALGEAESDDTRIELSCNLALAAAYRGDVRAAEQALAASRATATGDARVAFRRKSAEALVALRSGDASRAAAAYAEAVRIAEDGGLDDRVASSALNGGVAYHQLGDYGRALSAYERGLRMARALAMATTSATLASNLGKLYVDIGQFERASEHATAARDLARSQSLTMIEASSEASLADIARLQGDPARARAHLEAAKALVRAAGARRELVEVALQEVEIDLAEGGVAAAERRIAEIHDTLGEPTNVGEDVRVRLLSLDALAKLASRREGAAREVIATLEPLCERDAVLSQRPLAARLFSTIADAYAALSAPTVESANRARAKELWERILAGLPEALHEAFRRHPARAALFRVAPEERSDHALADGAKVEPPRGAGRSIENVLLRRLIEINRRLNSQETAREVLETTMDAAIELASAERGFLIVRGRTGRGPASAAAGDEESELDVPVARNLDRERIGRSHLKFSKTIALRAMQSAEPIVVADATFDPRFARRESVHAMRLRSVLAVPIRARDEAIGAIYVDNRFRGASFGGFEAECLLALADQAALALTKARLVEELRARADELEAGRRAIEQLAEGQAAEIARLRAELSPKVEAAKERALRVGLVGTSAPMVRVYETILRVAPTDVTVLVTGESGTGKELVARAIHAESGRNASPFVAVNCGALPEALLEAELFGYKRGAFTGASRDYGGLFVAANGGTLFLDELGEMPLSMQVKLLRVLQEREVRPLGSEVSVPVDVRVLCATNRNLREEVEEGRFREDLFYRVSVVDIPLPPLRERLEDVPAIAEAIVARIVSQTGRARASGPLLGLGRDATRALLRHAWPGNVRELENVLTRAVLMAEGDTIGARDIQFETAAPSERTGRGYKPAEAARMRTTLEAMGWNVAAAARSLGIPRASFYRKLRRYKLSPPPREASRS
jgi:transcriptional regulator with GAF, ATPase, and Fis domain/tetratricopeptide (TPR) repeat protein